MTATGHLITAIIGAGVLGLPNAVAWLGWVGGLVCLCAFYATTAITCTMLTDCYHVKGKRHTRYKWAVLHIMVRPWRVAGRWHDGTQRARVFLSRGGAPAERNVVAAWSGAAQSAGGRAVRSGLHPEFETAAVVGPAEHDTDSGGG
jgi:hypothetical protein